MENIRQAVERAKASKGPSRTQIVENLGLPRRRVDPGADAPNEAASRTGDTEANSAYLLSQRIVCHNGADQRSRPYDMLRTQVIQSMNLKGWQILGVTSPTPGCGKTLTAVNLALSIARQPEHPVVLV